MMWWLLTGMGCGGDFLLVLGARCVDAAFGRGLSASLGGVLKTPGAAVCVGSRGQVSILVLLTPGASAAWGARGYDCGPEPSLRTAPSSSSLSPPATAFRFPRAHLHAPRPKATATPCSGDSGSGIAGASCLLGVLASGGVWRKVLRGPLRGGRAGGLAELTRCLAARVGAARFALDCCGLRSVSSRAAGRRCWVAARRAHWLRSARRCGGRVPCGRGSRRSGG